MRRSTLLCPWCDQPKAPGLGYCLTDHAANMRIYRQTYQPSEEQRRKANARSYLNVYIRRGKVTRGPCEICGAEPAQGHHHEGYDKPLSVRWLCRKHHRAEHRQ